MQSNGSYAYYHGTLNTNKQAALYPLKLNCTGIADLAMNYKFPSLSTEPQHVAVLLAELTHTEASLKQAYCLNPAKDDDCSVWGLCLQPDISGEHLNLRCFNTRVSLLTRIT